MIISMIEIWYLKLKGLNLGYKPAGKNFKEMEFAMIRVNMNGGREATAQTRFLKGLSREFANVVELQHHVELEGVVRTYGNGRWRGK